MRRRLRQGVIGPRRPAAAHPVVPYGRDHANPAPSRAVRFADAGTARLVTEACGDCHSYRTTWPVYASVAPMSWLVENDVKGGRENLNFSAWDRPQPEVAEVVDAIIGKAMPPLQYPPHPFRRPPVRRAAACPRRRPAPDVGRRSPAAGRRRMIAPEGPLVVGVDGRPGGRAAAQLAASIGPERVVLCCVGTAPPHPSGWVLPAEPRRMREHLVAVAEGLRDELGVPAEIEVRLDVSPAHALHEIAARRHAAAIVLGPAHRSGAVRRAVLGDIDRTVIDGAPCPVLIACGDAPGGGEDPIVCSPAEAAGVLHSATRPVLVTVGTPD